MNASPNNDDLRDAQLDENDPVWRLLAESPRPESDGWFTARTLARCRNERLESTQGISMFHVWRWVLGGSLGVCLAMFFAASHVLHIAGVPDKQKNLQEAFEIVASFSTDSDSSSSSSSNSWTDSSL